MSENSLTPPLLKADAAVIAFSSTKDGKIRCVYGNWDDAKVVLPGQVFEVRWGPQGVEARIVTLPQVAPPPPFEGVEDEA